MFNNFFPPPLRIALSIAFSSCTNRDSWEKLFMKIKSSSHRLARCCTQRSPSHQGKHGMHWPRTVRAGQPPNWLLLIRWKLQNFIILILALVSDGWGNGECHFWCVCQALVNRKQNNICFWLGMYPKVDPVVALLWVVSGGLEEYFFNKINLIHLKLFL